MVKKRVMVRMMRIGKNLSPSFSFPLEIRPRMSDPMMEVIIMETMVYVLTKVVLTATWLKLMGIWVPTPSVGISTLEKTSVITSIRKELKLKSMGAPNPIAEKIKIT